MANKKALIIRFSSIGDIVLTSPVVRCLHEQRPDYEVHYLTKREYRKMIEPNPYIRRRHYLKKELSQTVAALRQEKYDVIIDLHNNLRTFLIKSALRNPSYSFRKLNLEKWLLVNLKKNNLEDVHLVDRYMETLHALGVINDEKGLDYFIPPEDEVDLSVLPPSHQSGYIAFVIGAKYRTKRLPGEKVIELCKKLDVPVILLGNKTDKIRAYKIKNAVGDKVYNACGVFNINQSASLIQQAHKVITNDTGLMHIASAFQKEVVAVWGNTVPDFGMYPYFGEKGTGHWHSMEVEGLSCRPCSKLGNNRCPKGHFNCMELQDLDRIAELVSCR